MFFKKTSLSETLQVLKSGDLNLISYTNSLCDRIEAVEPHVRALIPEEGRRARLLHDAMALLERYPDPAQRPPLFGISVGIKDIFRADGFATACGSKLPPALFEGPEAAVVKHLKELGALILGKTVTTEFAYFDPGPTCNPIHTAYTPGGSSSGSAAAVAAGFTPLAFGTQTIGSIIRPAAYCGVVGVKPTSGSISADGVIPFSTSLDHIGFFTHDLAGAALATSLLCSEWQHKPVSANGMPVAGLPSDAYLMQADKDVVEAFRSDLSILEAKGVRIIKTKLFENIEEINTLHRRLAAAEFAQTHQQWYSTHALLYGSHSAALIIQGLEVKPVETEEILHFRHQLSAEVNAMMLTQGIDFWLSPAVMSFPPCGLSSTGSPLMNLPWTFTGQPVVSVPTSRNANGFFNNLQFAGKSNGLRNVFDCLGKIF